MRRVLMSYPQTDLNVSHWNVNRYCWLTPRCVFSHWNVNRYCWPTDLLRVACCSASWLTTWTRTRWTSWSASRRWSCASAPSCSRPGASSTRRASRTSSSGWRSNSWWRASRNSPPRRRTSRWASTWRDSRWVYQSCIYWLKLFILTSSDSPPRRRTSRWAST